VNALSYDQPSSIEAVGTGDHRRSRLLATILAPNSDADGVRRGALRAALRWWRSVIDPKQVPLPVRARRRPGLTRADVAELAGLSLCWYTLLETAPADRTCSPRAIDRIADALRLEDVDRAILHALGSPETFRSLRVLLQMRDPERSTREAPACATDYTKYGS